MVFFREFLGKTHFSHKRNVFIKTPNHVGFLRRERCSSFLPNKISCLKSVDYVIPALHLFNVSTAIPDL